MSKQVQQAIEEVAAAQRALAQLDKEAESNGCSEQRWKSAKRRLSKSVSKLQHMIA